MRITPRVVTLTERRSTLIRLRREDVAELVTDFARVVEVVPTLRLGRYRVTARGYVGSFQTANRRWIIVPKVPVTVFQNFISLANPVSRSCDAGASEAWYGQLINLIADRLRSLMEQRVAAGLLHDYVQQETQSQTVRGRIDLPRQLRNTTPATCFHLITDEFTTDTLWNQIPKAAALRLLTTPFFSDDSRARLQTTLQAFATVTTRTPQPNELRSLHFVGRTEPYRELIELSAMILNGLATRTNTAAFLVNLEQLFQTYVTHQLHRPNVLPLGYSVDVEPEVALNSPDASSIFLRPDLVINDGDDKPQSVWDVKWKTLREFTPLAEDVHQVLSYAALLGVTRAGLIYPGRRWNMSQYQRTGCPIRLHIVQVPVTGSLQKCERAIDRLGQLATTS